MHGSTAWDDMNLVFMLGRPVRRYIAEVQQLDGNDTAPQAPGNINDQDIEEALQASKPSASVHESQYEEFSNQYGQSAG